MPGASLGHQAAVRWDGDTRYQQHSPVRGAAPVAEAGIEQRGGSSRASSRLGSTRGASYRIVYSSDDSLSDGELHVERRAGSIRAWYEQGASAAVSSGGRLHPQRAPAPASSTRTHSTITEGEPPLRSSVTVVVHDVGEGSEADEHSSSSGDGGGSIHIDGDGGAVPVSKQELEEMITWETNNLFDYLRGLCQHPRPEDGQRQGASEFDSEELARRIAALRQLLQERDFEVQQLRRLLDNRQAQLEGQEAELTQQAQRIAELEEHIRQLLAQLKAAQSAGAPAGIPAVSGFASRELTAVHTVQKRQLASAYQPANDSHFVQLPAQSFVEHQGCGFWQSVVETVQRHPRRWGCCLAALLLLLLIVLCATLIPAAQRRNARPQFLAAVGVADAGASWIDLAVELDRPAVVSYMAFKQADLNTVVPGLTHTLLELIQADGVEAGAVYTASAADASLDLGGGPQPGLQQLAVACGWAPVTTAGSGQPAAQVSILSAAGSASSACAAATSTKALNHCARCPKLDDSTAYTLLVVAATTSGQTSRSVQVVNAVTGDASVNVDALAAPYADNVTATSFDLHFRLNAPGVLYWALVHDRLLANYGPKQLAFGALTPPSSTVLSAKPAAFLGGLMANGSIEVAEAGQWVSAYVQPPCVAALCQNSLYALQGGTSYRIFLVAVDRLGNVDPAPAIATFATPPSTSAPALLPPTAPGNITATSFDVSVSMDTAGAAYYMLVKGKPGGSMTATDLAPGSWSHVNTLVPPSSSGGSRRRRLTGVAWRRPGALHSNSSAVSWHATHAAAASGAGLPVGAHRWLLQEGSLTPGSLVAPVCYPTNLTCSADAASVFAGVGGLAAGFDVVDSGCLPVPAAGKVTALPTFAGLQNNTLYHLLLATEDSAVPQPNRLQTPAVFAVRTVDLSAPQFACGFPVATNITTSSFSLAAMLTKPGAAAFFVVLPSSLAASAPPTAVEVLQGTGGGGVAPAAAGNLSHWGALPWEAALPVDGGGAGPDKLWALVVGLQSGINYTAFVTISADGNVPVAGSPVAVLSGILTPNIVPPTFVRLKGLNATVDELRGTFSVQLSTDLDRVGQVYYALYRNYSCIEGDPSVADIVGGASLPPSICKCEDTSYCALVTAGSYAVPVQTLGAIHSVGGDLSPLPFESLRRATAEQLKCFQGGLGQATDTYNIYLVAGNALPSYTGLAPQCSNFAQSAAVAAAAAVAGGSPQASCPASPHIACTQAQLRPDVQTLQSGGILAWPLNTSSSGPVVWQQPVGASVFGRPAKVQLSLEGGAAPAFTYGPSFVPGLSSATSFGMQFALDKPALLIYAVFRPMPIDSSGNPQAPVLIATGRVPVFDAASNATTGAITACPWAPGGPMQAMSQYYVTYVARDKYGRMDGLCPGQQPGAPPRVCTEMALTGT